MLDFKDVEGLNKQDLRIALEEHYAMKGNPKADILFHLAWEYGHASGNYDVIYSYSDMVALVK